MVDKSKQIGLSSYVQLPQITAVGGHSSEKGSVLKALSCNSYISEIKVEIEYKTDNERRIRIEPLALPKSKDDIPGAIKEVKQLMGVKNSVKATLLTFFALAFALLNEL